MTKIGILFLFSISICLFSCDPKVEDVAPSEAEIVANKAAFTAVLEKHLTAVSQRDLSTLESTLSPTGEMYLILPQTPTTTTAEEFLESQGMWFQDTVWTFETKILNTIVEDNLGIAIVDAMYREPERNGVPYFNHMNISYTLRKENGNWYVIKDHASSIERTGD